MAIADWLNITFFEFDSTILRYFHELALKFGNILTPLSKFLAVTNDLPLLVIGWLGFVLFFVVKDKKLGMSMCGSIIIGAILTTIILKNVIYRPRPYISYKMFNEWWSIFNMKLDWDTSFPSGHACASMAGVTAFFMWSKKKNISWIAFLYPLIVGCSRIYLCLHYPTDVIAGFVVGIISAILCIPCVKLIYYLCEKFPNNFFSRYVLTGNSKEKQG